VVKTAGKLLIAAAIAFVICFWLFVIVADVVPGARCVVHGLQQCDAAMVFIRGGAGVSEDETGFTLPARRR
jgi:hypothetical protein